MIPTGVDILDEIIAGPLLAAEELPSAPASLRQPPKTRKTQATENASLFDDGTFPGM